ncbi:hypothetical protein SAMN06265222_105131 [Neorhodopirellula lusitana]|uniref:Uncharacterized protein n=1 Tax=Neorhodopirellula lusitana TaxID=445327 RepID=A0ABY1Q1H4_9BACT|nr:hypothetical protein [Neorhodopirellula lusitana]SMP56336.1 hypothetical protein SAMN06265222_105131 [Neorhodopirellula lusitana]
MNLQMELPLFLISCSDGLPRGEGAEELLACFQTPEEAAEFLVDSGYSELTPVEVVSKHDFREALKRARIERNTRLIGFPRAGEPEFVIWSISDYLDE